MPRLAGIFPSTRTALCGLCLLLLLAGACAVRPRGSRGPAAAAIDAAVTIDLETERLPVLQRIAERRDLSQNDQLYLVNAICHAGFGGAQSKALIALIDNPVCTPQTRDHISAKLRFVMYSNERRHVVEALIAHDEQNPPTQPDEQTGDAEP